MPEPRFDQLRRVLAATPRPAGFDRPRPSFEVKARRRLLERLATAIRARVDV